MCKVGIIMGSDSDLYVMKEAAKILEEFNIDFEIDIVSAHRTPDKLYTYAKTARERGINVIIAGAGGAAHLPGMVASLTALPVIGVPIKTKTLKGIDSLYSIVQMPSGVPVATVAINGGMNAGILAAQIIGSFNEKIGSKMVEYKQNLQIKVDDKSKMMDNLGYEKYFKEID